MKIEQNDFELHGNIAGENGGIEDSIKVSNISNLNCSRNYDDRNIGNDYNNTTFYIVLSDRFAR